MKHRYQINTEPSPQTVTRMELLQHEVGQQKLAVVWHHFLSQHKFGDIDEAWDRFEAWLRQTQDDIKALTGSK